jgi:hypothetical protein
MARYRMQRVMSQDAAAFGIIAAAARRTGRAGWRRIDLCTGIMHESGGAVKKTGLSARFL